MHAFKHRCAMTRFAAALALALGLCEPGMAQGTEASPQAPRCAAIKLFVPYAPGGGTDVSARLFGGKLGEGLKIPVIVENRPGAKSVIAYQALLREPADGCAYLFDNSSHTIQSLYRNLPYDAEKDFQPVAMVEQAPNVLVVNPKFPAKNMAQFVDYVRQHPGKVTYASFGVGTSSHLSGEVLSAAIGAPMVHVPYRGSAPAIADLMAGQVNALFVDPFTAKPLVDAGKVVGLAVVNSRRSPMFADLPSLGELGYTDLSIPGWWGMFASAAAPQAVVADVAQRLRRIAAMPDVAEKVRGLGAEPYVDKPGEFLQIIAKDRARWKKIVAERNIELD
jgi:tripartite-type tricarboxylate transporter receptor subunit TctC